MFTVIFAEKETIKLFEETKMFFGPLLDRDDIALCPWDRYGESLSTMVPKLYDTVEYRKEWRAVILSEGNKDRYNPFDFAGYSEPSADNLQKRDPSLSLRRRNERFAAYEAAVLNPLLKLTTALCGIPKLRSVISDSKTYEALLSGELDIYRYMLRRLLEDVSCAQLAVRLNKYQRPLLTRFVDEADVDNLISSIRNADSDEICRLIPSNELPDFINCIGNDPIYCDPEYTECQIDNTKKAELLKRLSKDFYMRDKLPSEVICISPRTFDYESEEQDIKWKDKDEHEYSKFAQYNLYSDKLKFLLFDILPEDHMQFKFDRIKLLCLILLIAGNELPKGLVNSSQVYRAGVDFNTSIIATLCEKYIGKLKATKLLLRDIEKSIDTDSEVSVDDNMVQRLFESDVTIPVKITSAFNTGELYCEYKKLGLSADCPEHEDAYWEGQYREIVKKFTKYLREPMRAIKSAVSDGFHKNNAVQDDRSLLLSETQIEDVKYHLQEEEQKMVDSTTTYLFDIKKFNEELQEADREIKRGIGQRMTRKKTLFVGLFAVIAYLIGFIPLLFSNINTQKSFLFSLYMMLTTVGALLVVGFVYLFILRKKLVNRFKHFNYVMGGICGAVNSTLSRFALYISHACNVMRDFSALKKRDSAVVRTKKILSYHDMKIDAKIGSVYEMFSKYVDLENINIKEDGPYENDYTILRDYEFEMPSICSKRRIEFLEQGNEVTVPIDYVEAVTLTREELYD